MKLALFAVLAALILSACSSQKRIERLNCPSYRMVGEGHDNWKKIIPKAPARKVY